MSGYTRRIYVTTAKILNSELPDPGDTSEEARIQRRTIAALVDAFAAEFKADWPNFNQTRFLHDALKYGGVKR
jgi:hypothetical protein